MNHLVGGSSLPAFLHCQRRPQARNRCRSAPRSTVLLPAVTICIPTYNAARYLPDSIGSVLNQDFTDWELVICDDGSTDDTEAVCARYTDARITYLKFENGGGQAANFNRCLRQGSGQFMALLHADDYYLPGYLSQRVSALRADPERVLATGSVLHVDDAGTSRGEKRDWDTDQDFSDGSFLRALLMACMVVPVSMVFRRSAAQQAGDFRPDIVWGPDWEWALRLCALGGVHYSAAALAAYRVHPGSGTASAINKGFNGPNERTILREAFARLAADSRFEGELKALKRQAYWKLGLRHTAIAEEALRAGHGSLARRNLRWAGSAAPALYTRPTYWAMLLSSCLPASAFGAYRKLRPGKNRASSAVQLQ